MISKIGYLLLGISILICVGAAHSQGSETKPQLLNILIREKRSESDLKPENFLVSVNPTTWGSASQDCENSFGEKSSLVSLDTPEKRDFINQLLSTSHTSATLFWTSGTYIRRGNKWVWTNADMDVTPLGSWIQWGPGYPKSPTSKSRIIIRYHSSNGTSWLEHRENTSSVRYICEVN